MDRQRLGATDLRSAEMKFPLVHLEKTKYMRIMTAREQLISDIDAFLKRHRLTATAFGRMSVNDTAFLSRLRAGADVRTKTIERLHAFMATFDSRERDGRRRHRLETAA